MNGVASAIPFLDGHAHKGNLLKGVDKKLEMTKNVFYAVIFDQMDYVRDGEIQGRSLVFLKAHCPCILPFLT